MLLCPYVPVRRLTKFQLCGNVGPAGSIISKSKMISLHCIIIRRTITISIKTSIIRIFFYRNNAKKLFGRQFFYVPTCRPGDCQSSSFAVMWAMRQPFYQKYKLISLHSNALLRNSTISIATSIIRISCYRNNAEKLFGRQCFYVPTYRSGD
jgi:putative component of membrane protein insertase Oxa1/YidC/SpoIIIJ protein YidD